MPDSSVISANTTLRGNVSGTGSLRIEGRVRGDVSVSGDVVIGRQAQVAGNVSGSSVTIAGAVAGDLTATVALNVEASARVLGDLSAPQIGVGDGALVRGRVETAQRSVQGASAARSARPASIGSGRNRNLSAGRSMVADSQAAARVTTARGTGAGTASANAPPATAYQSPTSARDASHETKTQVPDRKEAASAGRARKQPPPPTVVAPRKGAKGRKKAAKR